MVMAESNPASFRLAGERAGKVASSDMKLPPVFVVCLMLALQNPARGCLWDSETLATESARFPDVSVMLTGSFARHSREFHQWRMGKKSALVAEQKATALDYDDLAVSQHKLGDHRAAIATMQKKDKAMPGIYETYSNLGTFHIYTGELRVALKYIDHALSINANAHFGREKYQKWLVLWVLETESLTSNDVSATPDRLRGFSSVVARMEAGGLSREAGDRLELSEAQVSKAVRGVMGMMYFADFNNPILLEALGDLLMVGGMKRDAKQLASLCYLHASMKVTSPADQKRLLGRVGESHSDYLKSVLQSSLAKGEALNAKVRAEEMAWIAAGKDVALEFQKKYLAPVSKK